MLMALLVVSKPLRDGRSPVLRANLPPLGQKRTGTGTGCGAIITFKSYGGSTVDEEDLKLLTHIYQTDDRLYHTVEMLTEGTGLDPEVVRGRMVQLERAGQVQALGVGPMRAHPVEYLLSYRGRTTVKRALGEDRR